jgi:hypothetical protein
VAVRACVSGVYSDAGQAIMQRTVEFLAGGRFNSPLVTGGPYLLLPIAADMAARAPSSSLPDAPRPNSTTLTSAGFASTVNSMSVRPCKMS